MLRLILGGVALAATGYGVKRYFEDEYLKTDTFFKNDKTILDEFLELRNFLYQRVVKETQSSLHEVKNLQLPSFEFYEENPFSLTISQENSLKIEEFINILANTITFQNILLDALDTVILKSDDYSSYTNDEKAKVQEVMIVFQAMQMVMTNPLSYDGTTINRTTIRAFSRLKKLTEAEVK